MSGQTLTTVGSVVSFGMLFGIYMMLRYDFAVKKQPNQDDEDFLDAPGDSGDRP